MHNLNDKTCPLLNSTCLLKGCTFFNQRLEGCEISIMTYNLYVLKEQIKAQMNRNNGVPDARPMSELDQNNDPRYPRSKR